MNVLAIMAHPRDVAYFCGGTLMKYKAAGHNVFIALTTGQEAPQGWDVPVRLLGFEPGMLCDGMKERAAVLTAMRWAEADVILSHSPWDVDADHVQTVKLVQDSMLIMNGKLHPADLPPVNKQPNLFFCDTMAGRGQPNRYAQKNLVAMNTTFYLTPGVYSNDICQPEAYVDISDVMEQKLTLVGDLADACQVQGRLRGVQMGCQYAEGFSAHRMTSNFADFRLLP